MTLQKFWNNQTIPFFKMFGITFKKNLPITIIGIVLAVLIYPIYDLTQLGELGFSEVLGRNGFDVPEKMIIVWVISLVVAATLTVLNLSFLHSKKASDMFLALPINRGTVVLSRIASASVGSILPMAVSVFFTSIMAAVSGIEAEYILYLFNILLFTSIINICLIFIGALFMTLTGHTFDTVTSFLVTVAGLPILVTVVLYYASNMLYGFSDNLVSTKLIYGMSPVLSFATYGLTVIGNYPYVGRTFNAEYSSSYYIDYDTHNPYTLIFVIWVALSVVALILTFVLIKRRKSETAGEPYSFKFVPYFIQALVGVVAAIFLGEMFTNFEIGNITFTYILFALVGSTIASVVIGAIVNRGFKKTVKNIVIGVICGLVTISYGLVLKYDAFGFVSYIPESSEIQQASFNYYKGFTNYSFANTTYTEKEDIEALIEAQSAIIETRNTNSEIIGEMYIEYILTDGSRITRTYTTYNNASLEKINNLVKDEKFLNDYMVISDDIVTVYNCYYSSETDRYEEDPVITMNNTQAEEFGEAFIKDLRAGAGETLNPYSNYYQIDFRDTLYFHDKNHTELKEDEINRYYSVGQIRLNNKFTNTLKYLESIGADLSELVMTR